jgi:hypothetical protein
MRWFPLPLLVALNSGLLEYEATQRSRRADLLNVRNQRRVPLAHLVRYVTAWPVTFCPLPEPASF